MDPLLWSNWLSYPVLVTDNAAQVILLSKFVIKPDNKLAANAKASGAGRLSVYA
jgi:hypothetical protein